MFKRLFTRRRRRTKKSRPDYLLKKEHARKLVSERLTFFLGEYIKIDPLHAESMCFKRVAVRDQISRWGSCSAKKNLNFNFRIVDLQSELQDYIVVHELCHLKELNHGPAFWSLVEKTLPHAQKLQIELRKIHIPR